MNKHVVQSVYFFSEEQWVEPSGNWPKYWFDKNSYSRWAASEVLYLLRTGGDRKPSAIVEAFYNKMDLYSTYNKETGYIFSIARDAARDLLDIVSDLE